jgi:TonB family protein
MKINYVILLSGLVLLLFSSAYAQIEKFDVMKFTSPKGWTVQKNDDSYQFTKFDKTKTHFCKMAIYHSYDRKGSPKEDYGEAWNVLVKDVFGAEVPKELDLDDSSELTVVQGGASVKYQDTDSFLTLVTIGGKKQFVAALAITNDSKYIDEVLAFLSKVDFDFPGGNETKSPVDKAIAQDNCSEEKVSQLVEKMNQDEKKDSDVENRAVNLVQPEYPKAATAVGAKGAVTVQIVVDENGDVISAKALNGHPILQVASVNAAKNSKFTPIIIEGCKVKYDGTIVYNFGK